MASPVIQFGRAASLLVTGGNNAIELSRLAADTAEGLRFKFEIEANDADTPNTAKVRVFNLSDNTTKQVINEYGGLEISAGYGGNIARIFKGTIKQFRRGKERDTDSFLDIFAADGDLAANFATIGITLKAGSTPEDQLTQHLLALQKAANADQPITQDPNAAFYLTEGYPGGLSPRGKVMFGLVRDYMHDLADTANVRWSIQSGVLTLIPVTGYLPGDVVQINSATGMVGSPEATNEGVNVTCLLNPAIKVGRVIQLNNKDVTSEVIKQQFFPGYADVNFAAKVGSTANDGFYRVLVIEHQGDTRGTEWYTKLICLLVDNYPGTDKNAVAPYGFPPTGAN